MLNQDLITRIKKIDNQDDYDFMLDNFKSSTADQATKQEAIEQLKKLKPEFDKDNNYSNDEVMKTIKEGEADIDDIGGY